MALSNPEKVSAPTYERGKPVAERLMQPSNASIKGPDLIAASSDVRPSNIAVVIKWQQIQRKPVIKTGCPYRAGGAYGEMMCEPRGYGAPPNFARQNLWHLARR
jgi:hypothetical protein